MRTYQSDRGKEEGSLSPAKGVVGALALVVFILVAYRELWHAGFIWDDEMHITSNPCIVGPLGLREIWTTRAARYFPLTLTSFWLQHRLWGLNPLGYHALNVAMHCACAVALWCVLRMMRVKGAWLGAALWALHPVQVETVAWVTELKNTQSGLFYLLSILSFGKWLSSKVEHTWTGSRTYAATLVFSALAMASKSSTTILPLVLLFVAWWIESRIRFRTIIAVLPVFALSAASAALTLWTQHLEGANDKTWTRGLGEKIAVAGHIPWFYLHKLVWPHPLIFIYPRWSADASNPASYVGAVAVVFALAALWSFRRSPTIRPLFLAYGVFIAALLPVLGFLDQYFWRYSFVGDHFQYLASMAPLALIASAVAVATERLSNATSVSWLKLQRSAIMIAGSTVLIVTLMAATAAQAVEYCDSQSLWRTTLLLNPNCWIASNNLGVELLNSGHATEAEQLFRRALSIWPDHVEAHNNLGRALANSGRFEEAISHFERAHILDPEFAPALFGVADALQREGRLGQAADAYQSALALEPSNADGWMNLGAAHLALGRTPEAVIEFQKAIALRPSFSWAETDLGNAMLSLGRTNEAVIHYARAASIDPGLPEAANNLGYAYAELGQLDKAIAQYHRAIDLRPDYREAHKNLGSALFKKGDIEGANSEIEAAVGTK